jgi:hypothetical protein
MAGFLKEKSEKVKSEEKTKESKLVLAVYLILRIFVVVALAASIIQGYMRTPSCVCWCLSFSCFRALSKKKFKVEMPSTLEIIIILFIFAAEILGELQNYYVQFKFWDTILHTANGFICAAIGFALVDILNSEKSISFRLSPLFLALGAFCFSMTVGVIWEFFEFFSDMIIHTDMQKDTIVSTIISVALDPTNSNIPITIDGITDVTVNGVIWAWADILIWASMTPWRTCL